MTTSTTTPRTESLTAAALVRLDWKIDRDERGGMDNAARLALIERGEKLAAEFLACLAAKADIKNVRVESNYGNVRVVFGFRGLAYTWSVKVYRSARGDRFQDAWSIGFNMPEFRSSFSEPSPDQRAFYGRDGRDAKAETAAQWLVDHMVKGYEKDVARAEARREYKARVAIAEQTTESTGRKVEASDHGFIATLTVTDADKLAKLLAFAATL